MRSNKTENAQGSSRKSASLDSRYGQIGIPAVAAALQYTGEVKNAGTDQAVSQQDERWYADLAA
jgi:hypothetical protein